MLNRLIEEKWKTRQQADAELTQYRKFISEAKKYHQNKFASHSFAQERLDMFLSELLDNEKEYEELWVTLRILLTLSKGQAAVEREFSVNKEVLVPNLQEMSLRALRLIHRLKCQTLKLVRNCSFPVTMLQTDTKCFY